MDTRICLLFLFTISPCIALECSTCMHVTFKYFNMPAQTESIVNGMLSSLTYLRDESCASNTAPTKACAVAVRGLIDTCSSSTFTMTCMGYFLLPDVGLNITVVTRRCIALPEGTEDSCRTIDTLVDAKGLGYIMNVLEAMRNTFVSIKFNGNYCTRSDTIPAKQKSASSTIPLMPSVAVLIFVLYLV